MKDLAKPTIHTGGSSAKALLKGYGEILTALRKAQQALSDNHPNERDYYIQSPNRFSEAATQNVSRIMALKAVQAEIEEIAADVRDQHYSKTDEERSAMRLERLRKKTSGFEL